MPWIGVDRYGRVSTLVAAQVPVADCFVGFPDPTLGDGILDRIIHNARRLNLERQSQRKTRAAALMSCTRFIMTQLASLRSATGRHGPDPVDDFTGIRTQLTHAGKPIHRGIFSKFLVGNCRKGIPMPFPSARECGGYMLLQQVLARTQRRHHFSSGVLHQFSIFDHARFWSSFIPLLDVQNRHDRYPVVVKSVSHTFKKGAFPD
jgi:hypothetical protein